MGIVEQMRSFESDHEPDGWPAIQMKQVSALCDEVERLQSLLNGIASEVERLQSLLEQERQESLTASCRVAALEMELDSAKSIIDDKPSPRITEHDAREIAKSVQGFVAILGSDYSETWLNQVGRSLIAKLKEAKHD